MRRACLELLSCPHVFSWTRKGRTYAACVHKGRSETRGRGQEAGDEAVRKQTMLSFECTIAFFAITSLAAFNFCIAGPSCNSPPPFVGFHTPQTIIYTSCVSSGSQLDSMLKRSSTLVDWYGVPCASLTHIHACACARTHRCTHTNNGGPSEWEMQAESVHPQGPRRQGSHMNTSQGGILTKSKQCAKRPKELGADDAGEGCVSGATHEHVILRQTRRGNKRDGFGNLDKNGLKIDPY